MNTKERIAKSLKVAIDTKVFEIGRGILPMAPVIFKEQFPGRKAVIVTDVNTWEVAGEQVYQSMVSAGIKTDRYIFQEKQFHAEWKYVEVVDHVLNGDMLGARAINDEADHEEADARLAFMPPSSHYPIAVAVGSGVINDLCKLCSYHHGQQYLTIPTAASVDGYAAFGASISYQNSKQTFDCPAPLAILADIDVIANAPKTMTASGYADLAAKIPAGAEWMIADLLGEEPIIPGAWHVLQDVLNDMLSDPEGVATGKPEAIGKLFEGLTLSGFAMQAARSSRPSSCSDHLFSHILDMTHHRYHGRLQSHGYQVAIGTLTMCAIFDEFLQYDLAQIDVDACVKAWPSLEEEQQRALKVFERYPAPRLGYDSISRKYSDADTVRKELTIFKECWPEFKEKLRAQVYTFSQMRDLFIKAGSPYDPSMIGITRQQLKDMFPIVQLMRDRFTLFDLAKRGRFYDRLVSSVFKAGAPWDMSQEQPIL